MKESVMLRVRTEIPMKGPARYHFMRVLGYGASGAVYEVMLLDEKKVRP